MIPPIRAAPAHVNLIARDWRSLARFYTEVFGFPPLPPERRLEGEWIDRATGIEGVRIEGIHLLMTAAGQPRVTLEIFQYTPPGQAAGAPIDRPGFGHLALRVDDVEQALRRVEESGGSRLGRMTTRSIEGAGTITFVYARDPEGNILELQRWE